MVMNEKERYKEIGGYLQFENYYGDEYHSDAIGFKNARCALLYVLKARNVRKIHLPFYLCPCVREMCEAYGYEVGFYHVDSSFMPLFEKRMNDGELLYIVNYYGQLDNDTLRGLKSKYDKVIIDNVQAFYQRPFADVDAIYSCRKFFGVPDGGYVYTDGSADAQWGKGVSGHKVAHLIGRFEKSASEFYPVFKTNDDSFALEKPEFMSDFTKNLMKSFDYEKKRLIREENFSVLFDFFKNFNPLDITTPVGPFCYPLIVGNGAEVRKKLAGDRIYIPMLWPGTFCRDGDIEKDYVDNILPLPCDQRYTREDMEYLCEKVAGYAKKR